MSFLKQTLFVVALGVLPVAPVAAQTFEQMLEMALHHNPALSAGYRDWQTRVQSADGAGYLPDPMIAVDYFTTPIETRTGPQEQRLMLEQKLPWFGTRDLQQQEKKQQAEASRWQWQNQKLDLQRQLGLLYGELYLWGQSVRIARDNVNLLQEMEAIVRARYRVANASQPDLIRIQVEVGKAQDRLTSLESQVPSLSARLEMLLGKTSNLQPGEWPQTLPEHYVLPDEAKLTSSLTAHPALSQWQEMARAAESSASLAEKRYGPDITLRYGHLFTGDALNADMADSGKDPEYIGIAFNLPLWSHQYDANRMAAISRSQAAQAQQEMTALQLRSALQQGFFQLTDGERKQQLYQNDLIPKTEEALQAQLRAYQTGEIAFRDLLDTEKQLLDLQLMSAQAEQQRWNAYHQILAASGQPYPGMKKDQ